MDVSARNVILLHHFRRLLHEAAERGIEVAPIKGAHLATAVYPPSHPGRSMGDIDFLVQRSDWRRTLDMMVELGFRPRTTPSREWWMHEAGFHLEVAPGLEVLFEAHRYLFEPRRIELDHDAIWARSTASTLDGAPCRRLADEDHVVHICLHAAIHRLMMLPRALTDVEMLFRHAEPEADLVIERARQWSARRATWLLLTRLAARTPELDLDLDPITTALAPPRLIGRVLTALVPNDEATKLAGRNHRLQAALLWPWITDHPALLLRLVSNHPLVTRLKEHPQV